MVASRGTAHPRRIQAVGVARRRPGVFPAVVYRVGMGGGWEGGEGVGHLAASGTHFVVADQPSRTELVLHCQERVVPLGGE